MSKFRRFRVRSSEFGVKSARVFFLIFFFFLFIPNLRTPYSQLVFGADAATVATSNPKIGWVRMSKLFDKYEKTKLSESQLESLAKSKQTEREQIVSEIKGMRDELVLLNEQARLERQKAIEERLKALAGFDRQTKESLQAKREEAFRSIVVEIEKTVAEYAKENGFSLVLTEQSLIYGLDSIDVTEPILKLLNERHAKGKTA